MNPSDLQQALADLGSRTFLELQRILRGCATEAELIIEGYEKSYRHGTEAAMREDLRSMVKRFMDGLHEITAAATALSTASDTSSLRVDNLLAKMAGVVAALKAVSLTPEATAAIVAMQSSAARAADATFKVDTEVKNLDAVLVVPAPPGQ